VARVLVVGFSVVPGPDRDGVQLPHAVRALASRFTVDVLTLRVGELAYVERYQKTRMLRVPVAEGTMPARVEAFRRAVRRQLEGAEYDVVHFRDAWAGVPVLERRAALGYRTVFDVARSVHGDGIPDEPDVVSALAQDEAMCSEQADLVLCASDAGRRFLTGRLPAARHERVVVVHPGVDIDRFDTEPAEGQGPPAVLYSGAVAGGHGVRVLLRAFRDVVDRMPARLVLAGTIARDFLEPLRTALEQLGLTPHVELPGAVDNEDMPRVISRATVCVAPSAAELSERPLAGLPTKLLEYMACRRAVVAPRRSSVREVLQDGVEGVLFDPQSPRDLAEKLLRLLTDEPLRQRLADAGQRRVRLRFSASGLRRHLLEAYAPLLAAESWHPVGAAAARLSLAGATMVTGDASASLLGENGSANDTSPVLRDIGDDGDSNATIITGFVSEDTSPVVHAPAGGGVAAGEAWLVIANDGSITRSAPFGTSDLPDVSELQSPSIPTLAAAPDTAPPSPSGGRFVAGELDAREAPSSSPSFVAAGELLSPSIAAVPRSRPESES
jgi:glycosyltransferase involved in cell wall biosynthesis